MTDCYYPVREVEIDLLYLTSEQAKDVVIQTIRNCHSNKVPHVKFITGRVNHINANGERGVIYEAFPSWMTDSKVKYFIEHCKKHDGYYLVYIYLTPNPLFIRKLIIEHLLRSACFLLILILLLVFYMRSVYNQIPI
ncbi:unnamed protein product [Rhizophagus irregularis]|nr:unnamed protein product [Rhizophagus irregularis]